MKRKNGFTLVELLAVIVILAIIALIAVPIVMNVIEDSKVGAAKSSALGYLDAVEKQMARNMMDSDKTNDFNDGAYEISELETKGVKVKGDKPTEGWVQIEQGKIKDYSFKIGKYFINPDSKNQPEAKKSGEVKEKPAGGSSSNTPTKTYVYGYGNGYGPSFNDGIQASQGKTERPSDNKSYLRFELTNGELTYENGKYYPKTEACIYSDRGELCLKNNEYETSLNKVKAYFGWNDSTNSSTYSGVSCTIDASFFYCRDSAVDAGVRSNGNVDAGDRSTQITCRVAGDGYAECSTS